jgi:hypothetical protein
MLDRAPIGLGAARDFACEADQSIGVAAVEEDHLVVTLRRFQFPDGKAAELIKADADIEKGDWHNQSEGEERRQQHQDAGVLQGLEDTRRGTLNYTSLNVLGAGLGGMWRGVRLVACAFREPDIWPIRLPRRHLRGVNVLGSRVW